MIFLNILFSIAVLRQLFVKYAHGKVMNITQLKTLLIEEKLFRSEKEASTKAHEYMEKYDVQSMYYIFVNYYMKECYVSYIK